MMIKTHSCLGMLTTIALFLFTQKGEGLENVNCGQPHESVVAVDPPTHRYKPFFVKLHRCLGGASSPLIKRCVPETFVELNVKVHQTGHRDDGEFTIALRNHTKCKSVCVRNPDECDLTREDWDNKQCACNCKYQNGPPKESPCKENFRWNKNTCKCECAKAPDICPVRMTWSNEICGCRCLDSVVNECTEAKMGIDVDCNCVTVLPRTGAFKCAKSPIHLFLTLLLGQAVIILILICALVHWVLKRSRQNSDHSSVDKLNSKKSDEEIYHHYSQKDVESGSTDSLEGNKFTSNDGVRRTDPSSPPSPV
ncbi:balbiani ring protein 3-like isoform X2 [Acropora millepora]|uniref:balbiani ring protein 3-like isoform X2 n=1 Tax=Acropora millepora TaxID=45264 RepID=UPI001CF319E2|nr:balbiani ring protein 3-like isoform X2 [Acropora millepora]